VRDLRFHSTPAALINIAARVFTRLNDRRLRPVGLTFAQVPVLAALGGADALSQKQLVTVARIEQPSMAQLLARMERDGLVRRSPSPDDGRVSLISLTESGLSKVEPVRSALFATSGHALRGFSDREIGVLLDLLGRLVANLDEDLATSTAEDRQN
jgi:DNA-binding MarR family transcriptional regulator